MVRQMSQVWHVSWRLCVRCHGVRASDVMSRNVKTAAENMVNVWTFFFYALLSTNSMYSAIVHYITKIFHMPQQGGTKEREKK